MCYNVACTKSDYCKKQKCHFFQSMMTISLIIHHDMILCDDSMTTSSNGNIFHITGHLCGEFTGHRWIPLTKASDVELWCFFDLSLNKGLSKQSWGWWFEMPSHPLWCHCNVNLGNSFTHYLLIYHQQYIWCESFDSVPAKTYFEEHATIQHQAFCRLLHNLYQNKKVLLSWTSLWLHHAVYLWCTIMHVIHRNSSHMDNTF